jgi:hypothetical protein
MSSRSLSRKGWITGLQAFREYGWYPTFRLGFRAAGAGAAKKALANTVGPASGAGWNGADDSELMDSVGGSGAKLEREFKLMEDVDYRFFR